MWGGRGLYSRRILLLALLTGCVWLGGNAPAAKAAEAQAEQSRFCVGFLYCKETRGDTTSTQAFLWLYSTEERGSYSRFSIRPFYSREMNPVRRYFRRSILWPLGISEVKDESSYLQILPFYWHAEDPTRRYTTLFPFYFNYEKEDRGYTHLIPLYSHLWRGDYYNRYFVLGPLAITTYDTRSDRREWDVLFPLFHHGTELNRSATRLFPLYFSWENRQQGTWYRHVLPLYGRSVTVETDLSYLFPFYGSVTNRSTDETRTSAIGLPPIPSAKFPALALYEHTTTPTMVSDRLFPLYQYSYNSTEDLRQLDMIVLFRSRMGPMLTAHRLFPLYYYENDRARNRTGFALLGYEQFSLAGYGHDADSTWHQFLPLYRSTEHLTAGTHDVNALGIGPLSLFRYWGNQSGTGHRFFPLYVYDHPAADEWHWSALFPGPLSLYRHDRKGEAARDRFTPLYDWTRDGETRGLSMLGVSNLSLFHQDSSPTTFAQRFFPLYGYRRSESDKRQLSLVGFPPREQNFAWSLYEQGSSPTYFLSRFFPLYSFERDDKTNEVNWSALLIYQHKETDTYLRDLLLPLHEYERNDNQGTTDLHLVGLKPITLFNYGTGPEARHSYLFPLYDFDRRGDSGRISMLGWPKMGTLPTLSLFEKVETPSLLSHRFFPLYRYHRDTEAKTREWDAALLWWHRERGSHMRNVFLPLTDIERDNERDSSRVSVIGLPRIGDLPALTLFNWERRASLTTHRFFPVYQYAKDDQSHTLNWQALFLWWHRQTESHTRNIILPLADIERNSALDVRRVSLLGFPRIGDLPVLTLFNLEQTPTLNTHRFFPLYYYAYDQTREATDWNALWLYWHHADASQTRDTFFPLGSIRQRPTEQAWNVSALGVEPLSLIQIGANQTSKHNRFTPLWDYHADGSNSRLSFVGVRRLSFFSHETTAETTTSHLFPLWWHDESPTSSSNVVVPLWSTSDNHQTQEHAMGLLGAGPFSLYYQKRSPSGMTARIFPAWSYQYDESTKESRTGVLGVPPLSLYYGRTSPTVTENRLFPLFRYTSDRVKDESEFWFLWPLFDHKRAQGRTTETSLLWWLFEYRSPKADEWEYWVMGHPPIAMYMRTVTPTRTLVEVNPIIPGWRREYVEGVGTSWALFGGLVGMDAMPDGTHKLRLFWILKL